MALPISSSTSWICPRDRCYKVNYDVAMLGENVVDEGAVIRDDQGRVVKVAVHRFNTSHIRTYLFCFLF